MGASILEASWIHYGTEVDYVMTLVDSTDPVPVQTPVNVHCDAGICFGYFSSALVAEAGTAPFTVELTPDVTDPSVVIVSESITPLLGEGVLFTLFMYCFEEFKI